MPATNLSTVIMEPVKFELAVKERFFIRIVLQ